jgi:hypothetical protein
MTVVIPVAVPASVSVPWREEKHCPKPRASALLAVCDVSGIDRRPVAACSPGFSRFIVVGRLHVKEACRGMFNVLLGIV